jgi:hypothetical protein
MDQKILIELPRLLMYSDVHIERFLRNYPEYTNRVTYDRSSRGVLRELLFNMLWNLLNKTTKYPFDELEEETFIAKLFDGYIDKSWYRDRNKELILTDEGSFRFQAAWVEEMMGHLEAFINKNEIDVGYRILDLDISQTTLSVELWGDWRARKWCEENDQEYRPA